MIPAGSSPRRVAVALSGGVDSSVAAALLLHAGFDVIGITMRLWSLPRSGRAGAEGDLPPTDVDDARHICELLRIPFHLLDVRDTFKARVVDAFCDDYALGNTPNPCLTCNREIKFGILLSTALQLGASHLATGHYAQITFQEGQYRLRRAVDRRKDQSYVLYMLGQRELSQTLFPLGTYTKEQVRAFASRLQLPAAKRQESQDACFLARGDYREFLAQQRPHASRPGPIEDSSGKVIGEHRGIAFYTVGQRQGLGIYGPQPSYVLELDAARNAIVVGARQELYHGSLLARDVRYVSGCTPQGPLAIRAKIRYNADEVPASLEPLPQRRAQVSFASPQPAITPGQGVVFYEGEFVLGGGIISAPGPREV